MTNNKRNINHKRFVRKEKKEIKEESNHDLTKEKDPRRKEIANLNRGKFFCRKIWMQLHQKGRKENTRLGQNFSIEKFWMTRNKGKKDHNTQLFKLGANFSDEKFEEKMATIEAFKLGQIFLTKNLPSHSTEQEKDSENVFRWQKLFKRQLPAHMKGNLKIKV